MSEMTQHLVKVSRVQCCFLWRSKQRVSAQPVPWVSKLVAHGGRLGSKGWTPGWVGAVGHLAPGGGG